MDEDAGESADENRGEDESGERQKVGRWRWRRRGRGAEKGAP